MVKKHELRRGEHVTVRKRRRAQAEQDEEGAQKKDEGGKANWKTEETDEEGQWAQLAKRDEPDSIARAL